MINNSKNIVIKNGNIDMSNGSCCIAASIIQSIDERVADYIRLQIREGCKSPRDIQCRVADFVKENIFGGLRVKEV